MRKQVGLALLGIFAAGAAASGQPMAPFMPPGLTPPPPPFGTKPGTPSIYGTPENYGYPGYSVPRYDPAAPMGPSRPPAAAPNPGMPFGYSGAPTPPFPMPNGTSGAPTAPGFPMPNGPATAPPLPPTAPRSEAPLPPVPPPGYQGYGAPYRPGMPPGYGGGPFLPPAGPTAAPSQPYLVPREAPPMPAPIAPPPLPAPPQPLQPPPPTAAPEFDYEPAPFIETGPPHEPYTLYEGPRYLADVRLEHTRCWVDVSYMHWWVKPDHTPPLVTTGNPATPGAGVIGTPGATILLGDGSINPTEFSGVRLFAGTWLDDERLSAVEIGGFWVGKNSRQYQFATGPGTPVLAQPFVAGAETARYISLPGVYQGNINVNSVMDFHSAEANCYRNIYRVNGWSFDGLAGVRYLYLNDTLTLNQDVTVLGGGAIPFQGAVQGPGSAFHFYDAFNATNRFFGGQFGLRVNWAWKCWDFGATGKLGLGGTAHTVVIDGVTTLIPATGGAATTAVGSTLAQPSNIGRHTLTDFSLVPELNATVGYQICCNVRVFAGYNVFGWTQVARPSSQIDRTIDPTQSPTSATFVPNHVATSPVYLNSRGEFWAQGLNVGVELKY